MNKKAIIPIIIITAIISFAVIYFEIIKRSGDEKGRISGSGTIEVTEIDLSSKISGRIVELPFEEGSKIKKGEILVRLDYEELSAQRLSAAANLSNAEKNFARISSLYKSGSVSKRDYDNAQAAYDVAKGNYDYITATIGNAVITSPINGVLLERNLEPGEIAFPGTPIATIADLKKPWIKIYVSEPKLPFVKLGAKCEVFTDTYGDKAFKGRVIQIADRAEFTPKTIQTKEERAKLVFAVKIAIENDDYSLKPGMPADAVIYTEE